MLPPRAPVSPPSDTAQPAAHATGGAPAGTSVDQAADCCDGSAHVVDQATDRSGDRVVGSGNRATQIADGAADLAGEAGDRCSRDRWRRRLLGQAGDGAGDRIHAVPKVLPTVASGAVVAVIGEPEPPSTVLSEATVLPRPTAVTPPALTTPLVLPAFRACADIDHRAADGLQQASTTEAAAQTTPHSTASTRAGAVGHQSPGLADRSAGIAQRAAEGVGQGIAVTRIGDFAAQAVHRAADLRNHAFEWIAEPGSAAEFVGGAFNHGDHRHQVTAELVGQLAGRAVWSAWCRGYCRAW